MVDGSVTQWIAQLRAGDVTALLDLHRRYWPFLVRMADKRLQGAQRRVADEEDVAQDALFSFFQSVRRGAFPVLANRHDLLAVLAVITARRAALQKRHDGRQKRGGGAVRGESALDVAGAELTGLAQVPGNEPTPDEQVLLIDCYQQFMTHLAAKLRPFAELHLVGYSAREIAQQLGCAQRTVERKLPMIRQRWREYGQQLFGSEVGGP